MSTNRLSHLKEGEKIYLEVTRDYGICDDKDSVRFKSNSDSSYLDDNDTFYTLDELKQLANDGMPDEYHHPTVGSTIEFLDFETWRKVKVKSSQILVHGEDENGYGIHTVYWRFPKQKTELTLAEVEEKLGLEKGSLIIKD